MISARGPDSASADEPGIDVRAPLLRVARQTPRPLHQDCGSGLRTVALGYQALLNGDSEIVVAGGQESMSDPSGNPAKSKKSDPPLPARSRASRRARRGPISQPRWPRCQPPALQPQSRPVPTAGRAQTTSLPSMVSRNLAENAVFSFERNQARGGYEIGPSSPTPCCRCPTIAYKHTMTVKGPPRLAPGGANCEARTYERKTQKGSARNSPKERRFGLR